MNQSTKIPEDTPCCANCSEARATKNGKVACALLSDYDRVDALTRDHTGVAHIETKEQAIRAFKLILPIDTAVYQGWACLNKRYGTTDEHGAITNDTIQLDPDTKCKHWSAIE